MHNLKEWRASIESFLRSQKHLISDKKVLDIGIGDSTNIIRSMNSEFSSLDKVKRDGDINVLYADITDVQTLSNIPKFDTVICCEVLEHVDNPIQAAQNLISLCEKGGSIIITAPCFLPWHPGGDYYPDYWRFMPSSLKRLMRPYETVESVFKSSIRDMPYGVCSVTKII